MSKPKLSASDILELLHQRHKDDVFVPECKNGSSNGSHLRMDAWVMAKSWAHPRAWAYEIKVSRSDFLKDDKWQGYLNYCNELYFVCPSGLVQPSEVPGDVGLLWASSTGSMLISKKKATYRNVQIPESLFRYVLMARSIIQRHDFYGDGYEFDKSMYWRNWLSDRTENKELGSRVRHAISERIRRSDKLAEDSKDQMLRYDDIKKTLVDLGFNLTHGAPGRWEIERRLKAMNEAIPSNVTEAIEGLKSELTHALTVIEQYKAELKSKIPVDMAGGEK